MRSMDLSKVGKNIRDLREQRGWGQLELATRAGVNQGFLSRLERGRASYSHKSLTKIAAALNVDPAALMGQSSPSAESHSSLRSIPVLDFASVLQNKTQSKGRGVLVSVDVALSERAFAVQLTGPEMEPRFQSGNEVIIDPDVKPKHGCFVLAVVDKQDVVFRVFKELEVNEQREQVYALVPLNKDYPERRSDRHNIEIRGVAIFRQETLFET